ncbi:S-adenosylmethionine:tRNA ribosyltransferase-isomerase [Neolewinella xylanilytica]|uniref:S-adenosylmethionine:tRNA ribosyltransferase-isomerase n=1 Tax=Neolewinella xylanilytica TaxID=1514080 RepID=A0A2S6I295_9BACT|nr:S-adenosylmethionine:tRNA ribosyltransferase-isomerase [Neolewinella xylanilytica]PPK85297.1 S-adenosylmethionine:tRNA ribosyltransferase-isomerase [Neolewinella xylanilytica]
MMMDPRELRIDDFDYSLPDDRIARYPLPDRAAAKLLHYREGTVTDRHFRELPDLLPAGTLLVGNSTRVIHARLYFPLPTGRTVEIFCLEPLRPVDYALSLSATQGAVEWKCLIGGNRRWKSGSISLPVHQADDTFTLVAERLERTDDTFTVRFTWSGPRELSFGELLEAAGTIPLPPYLGRAAEGEDHHRYQTVFAEREGSVAAPTAGLHFTPQVMEGLVDREVDFRTLTLHVGAGTFKPVSAPNLGGHVMHREYFSVSIELLHRLEAQLRAGRPIVSIGTTSMRCLESLFYLGARGMTEGNWENELGQWVATEASVSRTDAAPALAALIHHLEMTNSESFTGYTQLMLTPAARPRIVDGLITNFHQPRSTLLLLVAAMVGDAWKDIYQHARETDYRFLSYGDSSLLWRRSAGA